MGKERREVVGKDFLEIGKFLGKMEVHGFPGSERGGEGDKRRGCGGVRATHSLVGKLLK